MRDITQILQIIAIIAILYGVGSLVGTILLIVFFDKISAWFDKKV